MWFCKEKVAGNKASEERRVQALGGACWSRHYSGGNSEPLNGQKQSRGEIVLEALGRIWFHSGAPTWQAALINILLPAENFALQSYPH